MSVIHSPQTTCSRQRANPWHTRRVRIAEIIPELAGVATYRMILEPAEEAAAYDFAPGQFNMLYVPGLGESAISHSGDPAVRGEMWHTIREAGNVTRALARLPVGATLGLRGPFGTSWPVEELTGRDVVIVAGGIGLAPLRPLLYTLLHRRGEFGRISLLTGARTADGLLYSGEYDRWSRDMDLQLTVDRATPGWTGPVGVVTLLLQRLKLPDPGNTRIVTCGPDVMMQYVARTAEGRGIAAEHIRVSLERNMQCAAGLCGHCQLGPEFVCQDGPVFRYDQVRLWMNVEGL